MITAKDLEDHGYRSYKTSRPAVAFYQKWIVEEGRKLFAIDFYLWEMPSISVSVEARLFQDTKRFPALTHEGETAVDFAMTVNVGTVEDVQAFLRRAYFALNCIPDPHNQ